jgi:glycerol-3-phosphate cytidylyltransferase|nr:adenylyltransferase/cytidyltransferase family protein [uncultured Ruminococcus sp.]
MKKYKVGFTMGVFDLFRVGHLSLLERCKELCDYLIVAVCGDDYAIQVKKKTLVFTEEERIRIIGALKCVD